MSNEQKPTEAPTRVFLKEVHGGVSSRVLGEGEKAMRPAGLKRPNPVAIPAARMAVDGADGLGKGAKPSKPADASQPKPVAIPPAKK